MQKYRFHIMSYLATLLIVFMAGCGKETVSIPDTAPTVRSTIPLQGATGVALSTNISATFNKAMNPATINNATFTVTGPGGAAVSGSVTYATAGSVATFTPAADLAYGTTYTATVTSGVKDSTGKALAANYVWMFTTGAPPIPPTVTSTTPANAATNVPVSQVLSASFSAAMNSATINNATFTVTGPGGTAVPGSVAYATAGSVATFTPASNLAYGAVYTATITSGAADTAGTTLAGNYVWSFTTITPPPAINSTIPANGATGVLTNQVLSVTFNEPMNCSSLASPATTFTLARPGAPAVAGNVTCTGAVATFTPAALLTANTLYTATISSGATSLAGTPLGASYVWTFRTVPAATPPTVISTVPANGATGVPINQALSATFSLAMNPATIDPATFTVRGPGGVVITGAVTYVVSGSVATFTPAANLAASTMYTATITTGAQDLAGTALGSNYVWAFTTAAAADTTKPTVIATIPLDGAIGVPFNQVVSATFSKPMNPATITSTSFTLQGPGSNAVAGLVAFAPVGKHGTLHANSQPCAWHALYGHDHHHGDRSGRQCNGRQLCLDVYHRRNPGYYQPGDSVDHPRQ